MALGNYSETFVVDQEQYFIELLDDIQDNLASYLESQKINFEIKDNISAKIVKDVFSPQKYLNPREKVKFDNYLNGFLLIPYYANIIIFNYTQSLETILHYEEGQQILSSRLYKGNKYDIVIQKINHIHGNIENNMILGVNDVSQIKNQDCRNSKKLLNHFIKPQMNFDAGTLRDN